MTEYNFHELMKAYSLMNEVVEDIKFSERIEDPLYSKQARNGARDAAEEAARLLLMMIDREACKSENDRRAEVDGVVERY